MLEIAKVLIEKLLPDDAIPKIFGYYRRERAADIGADIFCVYHGLNKVYITADRILRGLERTITVYEAAQGRAVSLRPDYEAIAKSCRQQVEQLNNLWRQFAAVERQIHLLDHSSYVLPRCLGWVETFSACLSIRRCLPRGVSQFG
jgi:hypothetical protein